MNSCLVEFDYADKIVALTGAGVSTLSGIRDFRGQNGVYVKDPVWNGYPVEILLDTDFFNALPDLFYQYAGENLYPMTECLPSIAHETLAMMEKHDMLSRLYTQNIDGLHSKAGCVKVEELHGSFRGHHCSQCQETFGLEPIRSQVMAGIVPHCPKCDGIVKPDVVFYGDPMDEELLDQAFHDFETADFLLVMGSSLTVAPVSSLPTATVLNGGTLVLVNDSPTPYDQKAAYKFPDIEAFCKELQEYFNLNL